MSNQHSRKDWQTPDEPTVFRRVFSEAELDRIASADDDAPTAASRRVSIIDCALRARDELRQTQVDLTFAIGVRTGAKLREDAAQRAYDEAKIAITDGLWALGKVVGPNEKARDASVKAQLQEHVRLQELAIALDKATADRIEAEGRERAADTQHKALRAECYLLGQLLGN